MDHDHDHAPHGLADLLDLDAEVLHSYLSDVTAWVRQQAAGQPRRVLDLGAGTGTGTIALARCFAGAELIAVDQSAEMLARIRSRAADLGLAAQVSTVRADLDQAWPAIGPVDVVWASSVMHELARPGPVLAAAFAAIRPGGLLAVAEMGAQPRFLPDDLGLAAPASRTAATPPGRLSTPPRELRPGHRSLTRPAGSRAPPARHRASAPTGVPAWRRPDSSYSHGGRSSST